MLNLPINVRRVAGIIFIIILAFVVLEFNRRLEELKLLNKQNDLVHEQATQAVQTQMALQTQVAYAASTAAVEEWARTEGKYIQDGDLPMVPIAQPGAAPVEIATLIPQPTPQPNWQEWWDLFFGEQ
jgi:hypothetical protein